MKRKFAKSDGSLIVAFLAGLVVGAAIVLAAVYAYLVTVVGDPDLWP